MQSGVAHVTLDSDGDLPFTEFDLPGFMDAARAADQSRREAMSAEFQFDVGDRVRYILDPPLSTFVEAEVMHRGRRKDNGNPYYAIRLCAPRFYRKGGRVVCGRSLESIP